MQEQRMAGIGSHRQSSADNDSVRGAHNLARKARILAQLSVCSRTNIGILFVLRRPKLPVGSRVHTQYSSVGEIGWAFRFRCSGTSKRSGHKDQSCITSNTLLCSALRSAWRASRRHARRSLSESGSERFTPLPDMTTTATMTAATTIPTTTITIPRTTATLMPRPRAPTATTATILMHVPLTDTTGLTTS